MSVNINININVNAGDKNKPKTPWKNGFFYSDKNTAELKKFDGNIVHTYSIGKTICDLYALSTDSAGRHLSKKLITVESRVLTCLTN